MHVQNQMGTFPTLSGYAHKVLSVCIVTMVKKEQAGRQFNKDMSLSEKVATLNNMQLQPAGTSQ